MSLTRVPPALIDQTGGAVSALIIVNVVADRTLALSDLSVANAAHWTHTASDTTARTWTIPANASVALPIGTRFVGFNQQAAGNITLVITTDTMMFEGTTSTTGSRTISPGGVFVATKITSTIWMVGGPGVT